MSVRIEGNVILRVRRLLYEDQSEFGSRFGVCRRTVIRWEQNGHIFLSYDSYRRNAGRGEKSSEELWADAVAGRKNLSKLKSTTAIAARKPASVRRRKGARKKAVTVKRRRGRVARRRSVIRKRKIRRNKK